VDGREARQLPAGGGGAAVYPGQLKGGEGEGEILGSGDKSTFFRLHEGGGDTGAIEGAHHLILARGPLVGVAFSGGYEASYGAAGHAARRLHQHLQVKAIGEAPLNLADRIAGESKHGPGFG